MPGLKADLRENIPCYKIDCENTPTVLRASLECFKTPGNQTCAVSTKARCNTKPEESSGKIWLHLEKQPRHALFRGASCHGLSSHPMRFQRITVTLVYTFALSGNLADQSSFIWVVKQKTHVQVMALHLYRLVSVISVCSWMCSQCVYHLLRKNSSLFSSSNEEMLLSELSNILNGCNKHNPFVMYPVVAETHFKHQSSLLA